MENEVYHRPPMEEQRFLLSMMGMEAILTSSFISG